MKIPGHLFLFRLYNEFKLLFVVAVVFIMGTGWFALHSHEEFPFLLFGMYSLKEKKQAEYIAYTIAVDGHEIIYNNMPDAQQELVATTLANAASLKTNPLADAAFIIWLKCYTVNNKPLEIYKLTCVYNADGIPQITTRELLYPHGQI